MYTIDDEKNSELDDEYMNSNFWSNNRGLIVKIIIIILCVIVLIWLFKALKTKRNVVEDESVHIANVEKVRLKAEDYFFIKNNKSDSSTRVVSLKDLSLGSDIIDANNKVCNETSSNVSLSPSADAYKMNIKLVCSTNDQEEEFLYHTKSLACLNCDGNTIMIGSEEKDSNEVIDGGNNNDDYVVPVNNHERDEYSCVKWSNWTKERANESYLEERSKTLVQGVKYGSSSKIIYGEWSEFITTPIEANDNLEVETKVVHEEVWSEPKTATRLHMEDPNIRILSTEAVMGDAKVCNNGYVLNDTCYNNKIVVGNLTMKEYTSGKYQIKNDRCEGVKTLKNSEGKYVLTYVNCEYNEILDEEITNSVSYNNYTYQEKEERDVTYYRARTKTIVSDSIDAVYTKNKYEEGYLPDGYVKVDGTEEVYYSYKIATCEK